MAAAVAPIMQSSTPVSPPPPAYQGRSTAASMSVSRDDRPNPFTSILHWVPQEENTGGDEDDRFDSRGRGGIGEDVPDEPQVPAQEAAEALLKRIATHLASHDALHAHLSTRDDLPTQVMLAREQVLTDSGRIASRRTESLHAHKRLLAVQHRWEDAGASKRAFWTPKRKREVKREIEEAKHGYEAKHDELKQGEAKLERDREALESLQEELRQYRRVEAKLDRIDDDIFSGPTIGHEGDEDALEMRFHVHSETASLMLNTAKTEQRARKHLDKALKLTLALIKEVQAGLEIGIDVGVATNQKHKGGLWKGASPHATSRLSRAHILRAKTISGDLHTAYVLARVVQRRVTRLPKVTVIELDKLPDMKDKNKVSELGLHRSLETTYAQARNVKMHIEQEIRTSKAREAQCKERSREEASKRRTVWLDLRQTRRAIVMQLRSSCAGLLMDSSSASPPEYQRRESKGKSVAAADSNGNEEDNFAPAVPKAIMQRVGREARQASRDIFAQICLDVGGVVEDDGLTEEELAEAAAERKKYDDIPGWDLSYT